MVDGWIPLGRRAPGLKTQAGTSPRRSLLWGYGGVNLRPIAVPAPEDFEDSDDYEELFYIFEVEEDDELDEYQDLIEYLGNQQW